MRPHQGTSATAICKVAARADIGKDPEGLPEISQRPPQAPPKDLPGTLAGSISYVTELTNNIFCFPQKILLVRLL